MPVLPFRKHPLSPDRPCPTLSHSSVSVSPLPPPPPWPCCLRRTPWAGRGSQQATGSCTVVHHCHRARAIGHRRLMLPHRRALRRVLAALSCRRHSLFLRHTRRYLVAYLHRKVLRTYYLLALAIVPEKQETQQGMKLGMRHCAPYRASVLPTSRYLRVRSRQACTPHSAAHSGLWFYLCRCPPRYVTE